jgi:hypothetical protein
MRFTLVMAALTAVASGQSVGSISGVVRDAATGQPIEGAAIYLDGERQSPPTNPQGRYSLSNIGEGKHSVLARGRHEMVREVTSREDAKIVKVTADHEERLDLRLARLASMEGTVLDSEQHPVKSQLVAVVEKVYEGGELRYKRLASVVSDNKGLYHLKGIAAGQPFLLFAGRLKAEAPDSAGGGGLTPIDTYYPSSANPESAEEIVLLPDEARTRMDIRGLQRPAYCVSGVAMGAERDVEIKAASAGFSDGVTVRATSSPKGEFHVCGLTAGTYSFAFLAYPAKTGGPRLGAGQLITVSKSDIADIHVRLMEQRSIRYEFVGHGGADIFFKTLFRPDSSSVQYNQSENRYSLGPEPFGDYELAGASWGQQAYLEDILAMDESVLHRVIHPPGGEFRVVVADDGAHLNAVAVDVDGKPIREARIAIMPIDAASEGDFAARSVFGYADQNGAWTSGALAPGNYLTLATHELLDMKAFHIDRLWAARTRAQEIELKPNATLQVKLTVQDLGSN